MFVSEVAPTSEAPGNVLLLHLQDCRRHIVVPSSQVTISAGRSDGSSEGCAARGNGGRCAPVEALQQGAQEAAEVNTTAAVLLVWA